MKIVVTGGSGFIGTRLIEKLEADGHDIAIVDIVHSTPMDILDYDTLEKACVGADAIYHLAAAHRDDVFPRSEYYRVNNEGTANVVKAAEANDVKRIIFTSTIAVYGLNREEPPHENMEPRPFNDYGKSKLEAEAHLNEWAGKDKTRTATIVRPVVVFGERNRGNVHTLINQIQRKRFLMIGDGRNRKSMAYVGNVADFLKHCLNEKAGIEIYNYADKPDLTTDELTDVIYKSLDIKKSSLRLPYIAGLGAGYILDGIARVTGKTFPVSAVRIQKFCATTTSSAQKCQSNGFKPSYSLSEGIERMIEYDFKGRND